MANSRALLYCAGGGIGDSLVASVVARALHEKYEVVDALTLPGHKATLDRVPDIDAVYVDDGGDERELASEVAARGYDAAIVTWATPRTARVPQLARIPVRVGQARRLYSHRFTHRVTVRSERGDVTSHWTDILLDYARRIGCDTEDTYPRFVPTAQDDAEASALRAQRIGGAPYAILHATNAEATKRNIWPVEGWSALARVMRERFGLHVVLTGSDADRAIVDAIATAGGAVAIAGDASIGAFGSLARDAQFFTGITTGTMHVAAAVGAPTVGIFPFQTDTPERWAPHGPHTEIVRATYPCRPGERKETCPDYACIANLNIGRIVAAIERLTATVVS